MPHVDFDLQGKVAVIALSNPPGNTLGYAIRRDLAAALSRASSDSKVKAIVLTGTGGWFSAGADVREIGTADAQRGPTLRQLAAALEASSKPIVASISGVCLGGGLELVLACHYRVADAKAVLGLPDIKLGLSPGAGGTQRLPRLAGIEKSLNMILSGEPQAAEKLASSGLLDRTTRGDPLPAAIDLANAAAGHGALRRTRDLRVHEPNLETLCQFAHNTVAQLYPHLPAPARCIDAIRASCRPFDDGSEIERELHRQLLESSQFLALRHSYLAERAANRIPDLPNEVPTREIRQVGVVGAGAMGVGIAICLINAGIPVKLLEANRQALERGLDAIRRGFTGAVKSGRINTVDLERRMGLIQPALDERQLAEVDLLFEAVDEDLEVKKQIFARLNAVMKKGAILASTTSSLDLNTLAGQTARPQDVIGTHFLRPANKVRLVEVVRGLFTGKEALATVLSFVRRLKKTPVVVGVCDGYIGARMLKQLARETTRLIEEGMSPQQIDSAMEAFGFAVGPFRSGTIAPPPGAPTNGSGTHRATRDIDDQDMVDRIVFSLVNEGACLLLERIAARSSDIDVVAQHTFGFPAWRGGPMFYADFLGLQEVAGRMSQFAKTSSGGLTDWMRAPLLARLAANGEKFSSVGTGSP